MNKRDFGRAENVLDQSSRTPEWFLGYDGACGRCSAIQEMVSHIAGGQLTPVNLHDPVARAWREEALGADVPFAPTLFRVRDVNVSAWVGKAMIAKLVTVLGPRKAMELAKEVGQVDDTGSGINRRSFAKGLIGGLVAAGAIGFSTMGASADEYEPPELPIAPDEMVTTSDCVVRPGGTITSRTLTLADLRLRSLPCTSSSYSTTIPCYTSVQRLSYHDQLAFVTNNCLNEHRRRWYRVEYGGLTGYIASAYTVAGLGYDPGFCC